MNGKGMHMVAYILLLVGGLNWGLVGLGGFMGGANWNVVNMLLGSWPTVEWAVYVLVGLAAIVIIITHKHYCKHCAAGAMM